MLNSVLLFLDVSGGEIMVIMLFILMFFGSKKIPDLARGLGKTMREFQNASNGIKQELLSEANKLRDEATKIQNDVRSETNLDQLNNFAQEFSINEQESTQQKLPNSVAINNSEIISTSAVDSEKIKSTGS